MEATADMAGDQDFSESREAGVRASRLHFQIVYARQTRAQAEAMRESKFWRVNPPMAPKVETTWTLSTR
jgi:hypothetical protein